MSIASKALRVGSTKTTDRAQAAVPAAVQLEFSFDEALNEADAIVSASGDEGPPPEFRPAIALLSLAARLQFTGGTADEWGLIVDEARELRFSVGFQQGAPDAPSASALRQEVEAERRIAAARTEDEHSAVQSARLFTEMTRHGLTDMLLRRGNGGTRRCAWCATWFTPPTKAKSRFCSRNCRTQFYNVRILRGPRARFTCVECNMEQDIDGFSGLQIFGDPPRVQIGSYHYGAHTAATGFLCRDCILKNHREWNGYIESTIIGIANRRQQTQGPLYVYLEPHRA